MRLLACALADICITAFSLQPKKKKGGLKSVCLAEEDLGGVKLVYLALKGFEHYVTFYAKPEQKFFSVKKLKISVAQERISIEKPLR